MSANVWRMSYVDQYNTTCCGYILAITVQHSYRGIDSVDPRWTCGGPTVDPPQNSKTIWQFMIEEFFFLLRWTRGGPGFDAFPPQQSLAVDPPHRLDFYNIKSESTGVHSSPTLYWGPVFQTGRSCKKPLVKNGTNFRHTAGAFFVPPPTPFTSTCS